MKKTKAGLAKSRTGTYHCYYCDAPLNPQTVTKDHRTPLCRGGTNLKSNLVPCCQPCNNAKGPLTVDEYLPVRDDPVALAALIRKIDTELALRPRRVRQRRNVTHVPEPSDPADVQPMEIARLTDLIERDHELMNHYALLGHHNMSQHYRARWVRHLRARQRLM